MKLLPPTSYQGGKVRIASKIVDILLRESTQAPKYFDLCCGSGAISLELVNQGVSPKQITMLDAGPWGLVWLLVGKGNFPLKVLKEYIESIPKDLSQVRGFMKNLAKQDARKDTAVVFLLLQAASFGSKPIWIENNQWKNSSFRSYWKPTATSNRRSPVNPMMPLPDTLYTRMQLICDKMLGVCGLNQNIETFMPVDGSIVYIDPPYKNRTGYGHNFDVVKYAKSLSQKCFVSEGQKLSDQAHLIVSSSSRKKGGIQGSKKIKSNEEWLNCFS
jgi:16S rRNA G966 N2-methylase RsmD